MTSQFTAHQFPFHTVGVTGGTGTVGSVLVKVLLNQFPDVNHICTSYRNPHSPRVSRLPDSGRLCRVQGHIADPQTARAVVDPADVVFHLAGWLANTDLPANPDDVYITNSLATAIIARLCAQQHTPMVYTSSHSVYFAGTYEGRISADTFVFRTDFVQWIDAVAGPYYALADELIDGSRPFGTVAEAVAAIHAQFPPPFDPKIYDSDAYHIYCLTKLLGERFALDHGATVLRLSNVYGPGDDSLQAVGEACQRILSADPGDHLEIRQPFKKLVPCFLGDIVKALLRASVHTAPEGDTPLFTVASQDSYLKEDALLSTVASSLNALRGENRVYDIEMLTPDTPPSFTYDLAKLTGTLLAGETLTPFGEGLEQHLRWLTTRSDGRTSSGLTVSFDSGLRYDDN